MRVTSCVVALLLLVACDTNTGGILGIANGGGGGSGVATHLAFTVQPTSTTSGAAISPAVQVAALSSSNITDTTFTSAVAIGLSNPGGVSLGGTDTVTAVRGVATFQNLVVSGTGTSVRLTASGPSVTSASSATFNVGP